MFPSGATITTLPDVKMLITCFVPLLVCSSGTKAKAFTALHLTAVPYGRCKSMEAGHPYSSCCNRLETGRSHEKDFVSFCQQDEATDQSVSHEAAGQFCSQMWHSKGSGVATTFPCEGFPNDRSCS